MTQPPPTSTTNHRQLAQGYAERLVAHLQAHPQRAVLRSLIEECGSLARAIGAFHMEGIRFRMFNVDRLLSRGGLPVPAEAQPLFESTRRELEAAGFHTRSH